MTADAVAGSMALIGLEPAGLGQGPGASLEQTQRGRHLARQLVRCECARVTAGGPGLDRGAELTRAVRGDPGGEQRGTDPGEGVAGAGLGGPGRAGQGDEDRTGVRGGDQLGRSLEQDGGTGLVGGPADGTQRVRLDLGPLDPEQPGQLAGVRGQQPAGGRLGSLAPGR